MHHNARAAWRCTKCGADLCPGCAAEDSVHGAKIVRCATCGGVAEVLMVRKEIVPYWGMFGPFLKAIFSMEGLLQFLGLAVILYLVGHIPLIGGILYGGVWVSYYFLVILKASTGVTKLPRPADFTDFIDDMVLPLVRFILASLILVVPTYLYVRSQIGFLNLMMNPRDALADPVLLLIIGLSVIYFPAAIITAAIARSTVAMLNPAVILGIILRIPGHYFLTVLVWVIMNVADFWLMGLLAPVLARFYVSVLTPVLLTAISLIIPILTAFVLGWLIYQNGEVLGLSRGRDLMVPEVPGATPRGTLPAPQEQQAESRPEPVAPPCLGNRLDDRPYHERRSVGFNLRGIEIQRAFRCPCKGDRNEGSLFSPPRHPWRADPGKPVAGCRRDRPSGGASFGNSNRYSSRDCRPIRAGKPRSRLLQGYGI